MVCATYRLAGSRKSRHTVVLFEVRHIDDKHMGWDGTEGETNLVELKLVHTAILQQARENVPETCLFSTGFLLAAEGRESGPT
jgi:hypothetical protein